MMTPESPDRLCDATMSHRISPRTMRIFVTFCIALAHLFFLYGQTAIMWYLFSEIRANVEISAESLESRLAFRALKLHNPMNVSINFHKTIQEFTYMDAIRGLWTGHTGPVDPRFKNPGPGPWGKVSAILLIFFSAIWPHIKLIGLNYQYHRRVNVGNEESRTTTLYWLDAFGKWSLADVFVICTLLAVLNLDIPLEADRLMDALRLQLAELSKQFTSKDAVTDVSRAVCQQLLFPNDECDDSYIVGECAALSKNSCDRCACVLETVFPSVKLLLRAVDQILKGVSAEGSIVAILRVAGRSGIYIFCLGTLMSLSLSWIIDAVDHRTRSKRKIGARTVEEGAFFSAVNEARSKENIVMVSLTRRGTLLADMINSTSSMATSNAAVVNLDDPLLAPSADTNQELLIPLQTPRVVQAASATRRLHPAPWLQPAAVIGFAFACVGVFMPTLERRAPGSIMDIVRDDLNVSFSRDYSIKDLVELTGVARGPDLLLCLAFGLFVMLGPILRGFIICLLAFLPMPSRPQRKLAFFTNTLGVLSGWDVVLVAFILVTLEMPRITQGIVSPSLPVCRLLHQLGSVPYCISIEFVFKWPQFLFIPIAALCLVFSAARIIRVAFFTFDPFGDGYQGAPRSVSALVG